MISPTTTTKINNAGPSKTTTTISSSYTAVVLASGTASATANHAITTQEGMQQQQNQAGQSAESGGGSPSINNNHQNQHEQKFQPNNNTVLTTIVKPPPLSPLPSPPPSVHQQLTPYQYQQQHQQHQNVGTGGLRMFNLLNGVQQQQNLNTFPPPSQRQSLNFHLHTSQQSSCLNQHRKVLSIKQENELEQDGRGGMFLPCSPQQLLAAAQQHRQHPQQPQTLRFPPGMIRSFFSAAPAAIIHPPQPAPHEHGQGRIITDEDNEDVDVVSEAEGQLIGYQLDGNDRDREQAGQPASSSSASINNGDEAEDGYVPNQNIVQNSSFHQSHHPNHLNTNNGRPKISFNFEPPTSLNQNGGSASGGGGSFFSATPPAALMNGAMPTPSPLFPHQLLNRAQFQQQQQQHHPTGQSSSSVIGAEYQLLNGAPHPPPPSQQQQLPQSYHFRGGQFHEGSSSSNGHINHQSSLPLLSNNNNQNNQQSSSLVNEYSIPSEYSESYQLVTESGLPINHRAIFSSSSSLSNAVARIAAHEENHEHLQDEETEMEENEFGQSAGRPTCGNLKGILSGDSMNFVENQLVHSHQQHQQQPPSTSAMAHVFEGGQILRLENGQLVHQEQTRTTNFGANNNNNNKSRFLMQQQQELTNNNENNGHNRVAKCVGQPGVYDQHQHHHDTATSSTAGVGGYDSERVIMNQGQHLVEYPFQQQLQGQQMIFQGAASATNPGGEKENHWTSAYLSNPKIEQQQYHHEKIISNGDGGLLMMSQHSSVANHVILSQHQQLQQQQLYQHQQQQQQILTATTSLNNNQHELRKPNSRKRKHHSPLVITGGAVPDANGQLTEIPRVRPRILKPPTVTGVVSTTTTSNGKTRQYLNEYQISRLEDEFLKHFFLSSQQMNDLATELNITRKQVTHWMINRRVKARKMNPEAKFPVSIKDPVRNVKGVPPKEGDAPRYYH